MRKGFVLFAVAVVAVCFGCKEEIIKVIMRPPEQHLIIGWWEWIETNGMFGLSTPATVGYTQTFRFDPDSIFYYYRNDTLLEQRHYQVVEDSIPVSSGDTLDVLLIEHIGRGDWTLFTFSFTCRDTLTLTTHSVESEISKWVRRKERE